MKSTLLGIAVALAMAISAPASAATYLLTFTDSNSDSGNLFLHLASPASPTGTVISSITGMLNGYAASAKPGQFGGDQKLYSTSPIADYQGIGLTDTNGDLLNLYFNNPSRTGPGELAICFEVGCDQTAGFYAVGNNFSLTAVPEAATWALMLLGLAGVGAGLRVSRDRFAGAAA